MRVLDAADRRNLVWGVFVETPTDIVGFTTYHVLSTIHGHNEDS
jgi:hypothetical protein